MANSRKARPSEARRGEEMRRVIAGDVIAQIGRGIPEPLDEDDEGKPFRKMNLRDVYKGAGVVNMNEPQGQRRKREAIYRSTGVWPR